jgi:uncharacterized protein
MRSETSAETSAEMGADTSADMLDEVLALAGRVPYVLVATADRAGVPHLASSADLAAAPNGRLALTEWFCPITLENVHANPHVTVVVWDTQRDVGYQLLGVVETIKDRSLLNGYGPDAEAELHVPQVERELVVRIEQVLSFSHAPHLDRPLHPSGSTTEVFR